MPLGHLVIKPTPETLLTVEKLCSRLRNAILVIQELGSLRHTTMQFVREHPNTPKNLSLSLCQVLDLCLFYILIEFEVRFIEAAVTATRVLVGHVRNSTR